MSKVPIYNPPANLTMDDVRAYVSKFGSLAKTSRYIVRILPQGRMLIGKGYGTFTNELTYLCEAAEMPGRSFMSVEGRYYGPGFKIPYQSTYEDTTYTFICRTESYERQFFDDWMEVINPTNLWDFNYRDQYLAEIQIYQMAEYGIGQNKNNYTPGYTPPPDTAPVATYQWTLHGAFPVVINPQPITWSDDAYQRLGVSFTYSHWTRVGRDKTPGNFIGANDGFIKGSQVFNLPLEKKL